MDNAGRFGFIELEHLWGKLSRWQRIKLCVTAKILQIKQFLHK